MASWTRAAAASLALLTLAGLGAQPAPALAQEADPHALAARLFTEASEAQDRHDYDEACPKFARVVELDPAKVGAKVELARCYEQAGKLASAVAAYRAVAALPAEAVVSRPEWAAGKVVNRPEWAAGKVVELEPKAPRMVIHVSEALRSLPGLVVLRDGAPLDASQYNRPMLADRGEHAIYVTAPGKKPWSFKVMVIAGTTPEIVIAGLEDLAPTVPAEAPPAPRKAANWTWVTGGLGLASGGVAIAFAVDQAATQRDFDARCANPPRDPQVSPPRDPQVCGDRTNRLNRDFGLWLGFGAAGVAALAAATIGIVTAPRRRPRAPGNAPARASFWIVPQGSGAALMGRF